MKRKGGWPLKQELGTIDHPPHYNRGSIEVIDFIEDQELGFHLGNVVKYLARAGFKPQADKVTDLRKAEWYLRSVIGKLEREG